MHVANFPVIQSSRFPGSYLSCHISSNSFIRCRASKTMYMFFFFFHIGPVQFSLLFGGCDWLPETQRILLFSCFTIILRTYDQRSYHLFSQSKLSRLNNSHLPVVRGFSQQEYLVIFILYQMTATLQIALSSSSVSFIGVTITLQSLNFSQRQCLWLQIWFM